MITPELKNYITQSRLSGMTDVQIRQTLVSQGGWTQTDLDEAFGVLRPVSYTAPVAAGTGLFSAKVLSIVLVLLILAGAGGYFAFFRNTSINSVDTLPDSNGVSTNSNPSSSPTSNTSALGSFTCRDIWPESNFKVVTGHDYDDFDFKEVKNSSAHPDTLICSWVGKPTKEGALGTTGLLFDFSITWEKDIEKLYDPKILAQAYPNLLWVDNIGSKAWTILDDQGKPGFYLYILSSNKKYSVTLVVPDFKLTGVNPKNQERFEAEKDIAKLIDANLNKY